MIQQINLFNAQTYVISCKIVLNNTFPITKQSISVFFILRYYSKDYKNTTDLGKPALVNSHCLGALPVKLTFTDLTQMLIWDSLHTEPYVKIFKKSKITIYKAWL